VSPVAALLATAGWTLLWSALGHTRDLGGLSETLRNNGLVRPVSVVVPLLVAAEVGLGVTAVTVPLLASDATAANAVLAAALAGLFTSFAGYIVALRRHDPTQRCGCGGQGTASRAALGRALALAGCSVTAGILSLGDVGTGSGGIGLDALVVLAATSAAGYLVLHALEAVHLEVRA
jgi:hypothetical protein